MFPDTHEKETFPLPFFTADKNSVVFRGDAAGYVRILLTLCPERAKPPFPS